MYENGDIVESDIDLSRPFPLKFQRVGGRSARPLEPLEEDEGSEPLEEENAPEKPAESVEKPSLGEDVTFAWPIAKEEGFVVYKKGGYYHVHEGDEGEPLNPKGLRKKQVKPFVKICLED